MSAAHENRSAATVGAASISPSYSVVYAHQDLRDADARSVSEIKRILVISVLKALLYVSRGLFSTND